MLDKKKWRSIITKPQKFTSEKLESYENVLLGYPKLTAAKGCTGLDGFRDVRCTIRIEHGES